MFTITTLRQQLFVTRHHHHGYTIYMIFKSHCRNYVMLTWAPQEDNCIGAQNPNHTCPLKWFRVCCCMIKWRLIRKSLFSVLELKSLVLVLEYEGQVLVLVLESPVPVLVLKPRVLVNIPEYELCPCRILFVMLFAQNTVMTSSSERNQCHQNSCQRKPYFYVKNAPNQMSAEATPDAPDP